MPYIEANDGIYYVVPLKNGTQGYNSGQVNGKIVFGKTNETWTKTMSDGTIISCSGNNIVTATKGETVRTNTYTANSFLVWECDTSVYPPTQLNLYGFTEYSGRTRSSGKYFYTGFYLNGHSNVGDYPTPADLEAPHTSGSSVLAYYNIDPSTGNGVVVWDNQCFANGSSYLFSYFPGSEHMVLTDLMLNEVQPDGYQVTYDLENCVGSGSNPLIIPPNATVTNMDFTPDDTFEFNSGSVWIDGDGASQGVPVVFNWDYETGHLRIGIVSSDITIHVHGFGDPYADIDGEGALPGSGTVGVPGLPGLTAVSSGVIGLFSPSANQMKLLSDFMWTDFGGTGSTEVDVLKEVVQAIKRLISNPLDYIVGLNIIPSQGLSIGSSQEIRFGFVNSGVSMPRLTNQYFTVDCGSLNFDTVCGDTFLDYAPYSKFSIYLPYIGVKDVDANDFVGHTISVLYRGDVVTGGVTAYILKDGSVMYQYSGCCAMNVPLSADSWGTTISGAVQIATSIVAGAVSGGAAGAAMSAAKGAASVASNPSMLSPQVAHSGAVSGSAGCMGVQYPFVIREAVRFHSTVGMNTVSGYPSYYYKKLSTVHGYTEVLDVHLSNIPATDGEIAEIETLLKGGVIL